tara:strand:- start:18 stop:293 length:276 start_codon:yes stop_codon:yes gene_type:complete
MVMGSLDLINLMIEILKPHMSVIIVVGLVIRGNIMHEDDYVRLAVKAEKELLIKCVQRPGYAASRLQSQFGYTMLELQNIRNGKPIHKSTE